MDLQSIATEQDLEKALSWPYEEDVEFAASLKGDVLILGAGGKMGPTLVKRICQARDRVSGNWKVYAVSRFSEEGARKEIQDSGAETITADLMNESELQDLPSCPNVIYMIGMKFGTSGQEARTWAVNAYLPGRAAEKFSSSRMVAFSTGNVYPLVHVDTGGSKEEDVPDPVGEYAQSCLGRERIFQYFSERYDIPVCLLRLNYAVEARYGVLLDIATKIYEGEPVPLETAYANVIWQGDANSVTFRALDLCDSPAQILNVTGEEILAVKEIANRFGELLGRDVEFAGKESPTALLNDASRCHDIFGPPKVPVDSVIELVAGWITEGKNTLHKPTKFEVRSGRF